MEIKLENRPYTENASPDEIKLLLQNIHMVSRELMQFKEVAYPNNFTVPLMFKKMKLLTEQNPNCNVLIDLTTSGRPDAQTRHTINRCFAEIKDQINHVAYFTGKNFIINTAIRFIMYGSGQNSFSVHKTRDQALKAINDL